MSDIFAYMPVDIALDSRLSKTHLRVLIALYSFRSKNTEFAWPSRSKLSDRCGIPEYRISTTTTELEALGWLVKSGNGGRSMACRYRLTVPELETVSELDTVSEADTKTVSTSDTKTVSESDTGKEQATEQATEQANKYNAKVHLAEHGVDEQLYKDFMAGRKAKRAGELTKTAVDKIIKQAGLAGWTVKDAITESAARSWISFDAGWVNKQQCNAKPSAKPSYDDGQKRDYGTEIGLL